MAAKGFGGFTIGSWQELDAHLKALQQHTGLTIVPSTAPATQASTLSARITKLYSDIDAIKQEQIDLDAKIDLLAELIRKINEKLSPAEPPAETPPTTPPTQPPTTPPANQDGIIELIDFNNGTAGSMTGLSDLSDPTSDKSVVITDDPTGAGRGKVLQLRFRRTSAESLGSPVDRNRHIDFSRRVGFGESLFSSFDVYLDVPSLDPGNGQFIMRKLDYWHALSTDHPLYNVLVMFNSDVKIDTAMMNAAGGWDYAGVTLPGAPIRPRTWHRIEREVRFNSSPSAADGICRVWIDNVMLVNRTDWIHSTRPLAAFGSVHVGAQTQADIAYDELRYIDRVIWSTKRVAA